jgi:hypothetical protein
MSKAAQYEAEEKQGFLQSQPTGLYPQVHPQQQPQGQVMYAQPYAVNAQPMGMYQQQPMRGYPQPASVVVINQVVAANPNAWRDPGCCTICWGVFLLIGAIVGSISGISSIGTIATGMSAVRNCDPNLYTWCTPDKIVQITNVISALSSFVISSLVSSFFQLTLTLAVVVMYCKKVTSPAARAWNYAFWIFIAITQSFVVIGLAAISALLSGGSFILGSLIQTYYSSIGVDTSALNTVLAILSAVMWITTAGAAIPMIISSVVAHKNKAPCSCSTRSPDYVN